MEDTKKITLSQIKEEVRRKVKKEYEAFLSEYRKLPPKIRRIRETRDKEKLNFYSRFYIIVIIGDLYPDEWIHLFYYFEGNIIQDYYDSYMAFLNDSKKEKDKKNICSLLYGYKGSARRINI